MVGLSAALAACGAAGAGRGRVADETVAAGPSGRAREGREAAMDGGRCVPVFVAAGLPRRAEQLAREESLWPGLAARVAGGGRGEAGAGEVTLEVALAALEDVDEGRAAAAAFVLGRCALEDARVTEALRAAVASAPEPIVRIEAAMSLAVRGEAAQGQAALRALAEDPSPLAEGYVAASYLTQLGDPSGYPRVVATALGELAHYRLMAMRALPRFAAWRGERLGAVVVDPAAVVMSRAEDASALVRREVPLVLAGIGLDAAGRAVVERLAARDPDEDVRRIAAHVLAGAGEATP